VFKMKNGLKYRKKYDDDRACILLKPLKTFTENEVIACFDKRKKEFLVIMGTESMWFSLDEIKNLLDILQSWVKDVEETYLKEEKVE